MPTPPLNSSIYRSKVDKALLIAGWLGSGAPMDEITVEELRRCLYVCSTEATEQQDLNKQKTNTNQTQYTRWIGVPFYNLSTVFVKASALMFFLRFTTSKRFRFVVFTTIGITVASGILNIVGTSVGCTDLLSECKLTARVYIITASTNVLTDLIILSMPFFILAPLRTMPIRRKMEVTFVMTTVGLFVFPFHHSSLVEGFANSQTLAWLASADIALLRSSRW